MNLKSKLKSKLNKKLILKNLPFAFFIWIGDKISYSCRHSSNFLLGIVDGISKMFKPPLFSFNITDILIGILAVLLTADAAAALIGRKFGKHKLVNGKSLEGTLAFILTGIAVSGIFISGLV